MSYEPTTWKAGDTVTSAKLNKMEQGIANNGGSFIITTSVISNNPTLDKTWQEIYDAAEAHQDIKLILTKTDSITYAPLLSIFIDDGTYYVDFLVVDPDHIGTLSCTTLNANGYPTPPITTPGPGTR